MRISKGFTLIELLAVIVILAIIALVVTPMITGIISQAKMNASARSIEGYMDAINYNNTAAILTNKKMEDGRYNVDKNGNLNKDGKTYELNVKGEKPTSGVVVIQNGKVIDATLVINDNVVHYTEDGTEVVKVDNSKIYGLEYNKATKTYKRLESADGLTACVGTNTATCKNDFDSEEIYKDIKEVIDSYGNKFIEIPKFYVKKEVTNDYVRLYIAKGKKIGFYLPNCFYNFTRNEELDSVLVGKYNGSLSDDGKRLESKTNKVPLVEKNITEFRNYATANNTDIQKGYQQLDIHAWDAIQTLFNIEFATFDSQTIMKGYSNGTSPWQEDIKPQSNISNSNELILTKSYALKFNIGQRIDISLTQAGQEVAKGRLITNVDYTTGKISFDGIPVNITTSQIISNSTNINGQTDSVLSSSGSYINNSNGKYSMNYRGIENLYGNIWQFIDGIVVNNLSDGTGEIFVNKNSLSYSTDGSTSDYQLLNYKRATLNGYVIDMGYDNKFPFAQYPSIVTTSYSGSVYRDSFNISGDIGKSPARVGGSWAYDTSNGISNFSFRFKLDYSHIYSGSRLVKKSL